jgi:FkbM family methyltransferase
MTSWRRYALSALGYVGVRSMSLGAGAVLLTRRGTKRTVRAIGRDTWLVHRPAKSGGGARRPRRAGSRSRPAGDILGTRAQVWRHQHQGAGRLADEHIAWMLRELDINCVLDVGANTGQYGRRLRRAGYRGRIVSFEPVREFAKKLRDVASEDPDWHVFELALGDTDTDLEINARPGQMSSLLPSSDWGEQWHERLRIAEKEWISVRRLDGLFDSIVDGLDEPRVYLKLDTQGYDLKAFAGAGDRVGEILGMQSELSCVPIYDGMPRLPEQITVYESAGFEITGMFPVARDRVSLRVIEFDAVMVRPGAVRSR